MGRCQCSMDVTSVRFFLFHPLSLSPLPLAILFFKVEEAETERSPLKKKRIKTKEGEKIDLNPERKSHACSIWGVVERERKSLRGTFHKPNSHKYFRLYMYVYRDGIDVFLFNKFCSLNKPRFKN